MSKEHVLVIEDEEDIRELLRFNLAREGYVVSTAPTGEEGIKIAQEKNPELVVLDLMLPGIDGFDVCRTIRNHPLLKHTAIIMLTAKGEDADVVSGLELGADDYLVKPFSPRVLVARVRNVLRRKKAPSSDAKQVLTVDGLTIDAARHQVIMDGQLLDLTATEFKLLHYLACNPGIVFSREQIVDAVHGDDYPVTDRSVDVQVVGLRKKLLKYSNHIETVRGVGYKFKER